MHLNRTLVNHNFYNVRQAANPKFGPGACQAVDLNRRLPERLKLVLGRLCRRYDSGPDSGICSMRGPESPAAPKATSVLPERPVEIRYKISFNA
jgi:hypothetical protein